MSHNRYHQPQENVHHIWYEARHYRRDSTMGRLRTYAGFMIQMNLLDHRRLHSSLRSGTPQPDKQVARELMLALPPREIEQPRDYQLQFAIGFLAAHDEQLTAEHLFSQVPFIMRTPILGES